jgi:hypothetical protein
MTTTIEVTAIRHPKEGKKIATVVDNTGRSFQCFPDKITKWGLKEGSRFEIEIEERTWQDRTYRNITSAKPCGEVMSPQAHASAAPTVSPQDAEAAFVGSVLNGALIGGHVKFEAADLARATRLLQMLYSQSFGERPSRASEAASLAEYRGRQQ